MKNASMTGRESQWVRRGSAKKGCLIALAVFLVLAVVVVGWVAMSWKGWTASAMTAMTTQLVEDANLPQEQKDRVLAKVRTLADDFKSGKVTIAQLQQVGEEIGKGPLLPLIIISSIDKEYVQKSTLSAEEKAAGTRTLDRFTRGLVEKKITEAEAKAAMQPLTVPTGGQGFRLKQSSEVKPEELQAALAAAKAKADELKIPDEPFVVNVADELDKAFNKALGTK